MDYEFDILPKILEERKAKRESGYYELENKYNKLKKKLENIYKKYPKIEKEFENEN